MFRSVKMKDLGLTVFSFVCVIIFVIICLLALRAGAPRTVMIDGVSCSLRAENDGDIEAFIIACGYEPEAMVSDREITVPKVWNDLYSEYSELQSAQGFNLVPYKGKPAREIVYAVKDSDEYVTVLVSDSIIAAAHICRMDGGDIKPLIGSG